MDKGSVFLAVPVIPECYHLELPEARRQLGDRSNVHTHMVDAIAFTFVSAVFVQYFSYLQWVEGHKGTP
jgi:hypothetical protein